jgi:hypothetical protein
VTVKDIETAVSCTAVQDRYADEELSDGYTSDLLSDVMAHAPEGSVLITIQAHKNTVAVATLTGIRAIVLCNNRQAPEDMLEAARDEGIAVFVTEENQFNAGAAIHRALFGT